MDIPTNQSESESMNTSPPATAAKASVCQANREYQSDDADFVLVSSDGWDFRVDKYQLMAMSTIFRNMLCMNPPGDVTAASVTDRLELSDQVLETAENLELFLNCLYGKLELDLVDYNIQDYINVIPLFKKYDCDIILRAFSSSVENALYNITSPLAIFTLAAHLDNTKLCSKVILRTGTWKYTEPINAGVAVNDMGTSLVGASVLDPTAMSASSMARIPPVYLYTLLRATRKDRMMVLGKTDWKAISEEFTRLMALGTGSAPAA